MSLESRHHYRGLRRHCGHLTLSLRAGLSGAIVFATIAGQAMAQTTNSYSTAGPKSTAAQPYLTTTDAALALRGTTSANSGLAPSQRPPATASNMTPSATAAQARFALPTGPRLPVSETVALPTPRPARLSGETEAFDGTTGTVTEDDAVFLSDQPVDGAVLRAEEDALYRESLGRQNQRTGTVEGSNTLNPPDPDAVPGFMLGRLTLRPTVSEKIVHESFRDATTSTTRLLSETTVSATLESDWARHQLTVEGTGTWEENLSGTGAEEPTASIDGRLDLDLGHDLTAALTLGYAYEQESRTDPNAVAGAQTQSGIHEIDAAVSLGRSVGLLRGTVTTGLTRTIYGGADLGNGVVFSGAERDTLSGRLTGRVGFEISPALVPFLEAGVERTTFDVKTDSNGFQRSATSYRGRLGAEIDLGEKLSGELAAGYILRDIDDPTLTDISAFTVDGSVNWSPLRGTNVFTALSTTVDSATAAGESGSVAYTLSSGLTHELRNALVARLSGSLTYRDYDRASTISDQTTVTALAGLEWSINRYLSLDGDIGFERTSQSGIADADTVRLGLGLRLRR